MIYKERTLNIDQLITAKFETIIIKEIDGKILHIELNRPKIHNALNSQMMRELLQIWTILITDHQYLRCVILTGNGEKAFCAGADLKERNLMTVEQWQKQHTILEQMVITMSECPIPIIGAINGVAYGGGLEILLHCDFVYAADHATFSQSEAKLGLMPGAMATQNMPRACGVRRAKEIMYTAASFTAQQAYEWNIVNKVCDAKTLMEEVLATANKIADNAPLAVMEIKKALNTSQSVDLQLGYEFELASYNQLIPTEDRVEGVLAFNEKRKAEFKGK